MPGGMGGGGRRRQPEVDTQEYYDLLGVDKDTSSAQIKKAFRKMALKHHPDRGGDEELFKKMTEAADVLTDDDKRSLYDRGGKEAVEQGESRGGGGGDPFAQMFGGGGRGRGGGGPKKGKDMMHALQVSLEDCYNGKIRKLAITRDKLCEDCDGRGGAEGCETMCSGCDGHGVVIKVMQLGPGMLQQVQAHCDDCGGKGKAINAKLRCKTCRGNKVSKERKVLEVAIDKGARNKQKVKFNGESNAAPGILPGDVVFVLQVKDHARFTRKGHHLFMNKTISLKDALCGCSFVVEHLDGRKLLVSTDPGAPIAADAKKMIEGEGMPMHGNPFVKGNLVISFSVEFPKKIDPATAKKLLALLPGDNQVTEETEDMEPCGLSMFNAAAAAEEYENNKSAYDSDDEEEGGGGGQRTQCAQG